MEHGEWPSVDSVSPPERLAVNPHAERAPLSVWGHISLSALWLGINAINAALLPVVLPVQILLFITSGSVGDAEQAEFLGWLSALGAVIALLAPPLVGALSDRSTSSFGRRRPYVLLGVVITIGGAWAMAIAGSLGALIAAFLLLNLGVNVATGAYQGLLPDITPESQRGAASGYLGLMTILGNIGSLALAGVLLASVTLASGAATITHSARVFYGATALMLAITAFITILWTHETPLSAAEVAAQHTSTPEARRMARWLRAQSALWLDPWKSWNFTWVFLTRAFVMMGLTLFLTFIEYYFAQVAGVTSFVAATAAVAGLALLGAVISALALGILSDHVNRTLLVGVSSALMAFPALVFVVAPTQVPLWPLGLIFGLGYGAYTSVDWALAVDSLPEQASAGKDLGIWSAASTLPAILAPALGAGVIALTEDAYHNTALGYQATFALAAVFLTLGAICVTFVRNTPDSAEATPQAHETPETPNISSISSMSSISNAPATATAAAGQRRAPGWGWRLAGRTRGGQARGFLRFWPFWEWLMLTLMPVTPVPGAPHGLLGVHLTRYRGQPITLHDGTHIARGALVAELHFNNRRVTAAMSASSSWRFVHMLAEDMAALARWAAQPGEMARAEALIGVTLIGRASPRLGFTIRERPVTLHARLDRFFMQGLMAIYNPAGVERLERGATYTTYPVEVWMSRAELLRRYTGKERPARP
jgi:MFS family permease